MRRGVRREVDLCSGPAKLCQALGIDRQQDGVDLVDSAAVNIEKVRGRTLAAARIGVGPRVGIDYAEEWRDKPLRFWVKDNRHVSR